MTGDRTYLLSLTDADHTIIWEAEHEGNLVTALTALTDVLNHDPELAAQAVYCFTDEEQS